MRGGSRRNAGVLLSTLNPPDRWHPRRKANANTNLDLCYRLQRSSFRNRTLWTGPICLYARIQSLTTLL